jgi:hypothetical protein
MKVFSGLKWLGISFCGHGNERSRPIKSGAVRFSRSTHSDAWIWLYYRWCKLFKYFLTFLLYYVQQITVRCFCSTEIIPIEATVTADAWPSVPTSLFLTRSKVSLLTDTLLQAGRPVPRACCWICQLRHQVVTVPLFALIQLRHHVWNQHWESSVSISVEIYRNGL